MATDTIIVLVDGQIAHESYSNGNDARTPHILISASKAVVGLMVGMLENRSEIASDARGDGLCSAVAGIAYEGVRCLLAEL